MKLDFPIVPPGRQKLYDNNLPRKRKPEEKEQVESDMRVVGDRLKRKLMRAVRYRAAHDNYKEL